jgi:hypothetical protein
MLLINIVLPAADRQLWGGVTQTNSFKLNTSTHESFNNERRYMAQKMPPTNIVFAVGR